LRVELGRADEIVEVTLSDLATRVLSGRVVDEGGQGVADAWVRVAGAAPWSQARPARPVLTDAEGAFAVEGLLAGQYRVDVSSARGEGRLEDVPAGATVTVPLRTHGSLSVTVSTATGDQVPSFTIDYRENRSRARERVSGFNGAGSLPWLPAGTYELDVNAAEGTARGTVDIPPGGQATIALNLMANAGP
jgi:hypothetical protein